MLRIGLTGGIGSGKSTVCRMFGELGIPVIDADHVSRELVEPGQPALAALVALFGPSLLTAEGRLDRSRLRTLIFADPSCRQQVEDLLHPQIRQRMLELSTTADGPYVILAIPLLIESGWQALADRILVIDCPPDVQLHRATERDGVPPLQVEAIMASQASRAARLACANEIIDNSGDLAHLHAQVVAIHQRYLTMAAATATG